MKFDYKVFFDNSPEVIAFTDPEGTILVLNERISDWLGYRPDELIGKKYSELEFFDKTTRELLIKKYSQRVSGEDMPAYKIELTSKNGRKFTGQFAAKLIKENSGDLKGILVLISDITKQYEQTMMFKDISEKQKALFQAIPDLIFVMKRDGTFTEFVADDGVDLAIPRDEIIGKNIIDSGFSEEYLKLIDKKVEEAFLSEEVQTFEYEITTPKGLNAFECRMVKLNEGEVLSVIRNITRHKQLDEELRLKNIVFETSIAANSITDNEGNITYLNQSFLDMWGYHKKSEVIGRPLSDFFLKKEEAERIFQGLRNIGVWRGEFIGRRNDGTSFITQGFASAVVNSSGEVTGYQSTIIEISNYKRSAEEILEVEQRYRALFEENTDAVFIFNLDGIYIEANRKAHEMLGCKAGEITGRHISEFTSVRENKESRNRIVELLSGKKLPVYRRNYIKKDGTEFPAEVSISLIYDNKGRPKHFQSIAREMNNRKQPAPDSIK